VGIRYAGARRHPAAVDKAGRGRVLIIRQLSLTNFRNYERLELDLPPHITVLRGENAQGKSNLLEAVYLLATSRSSRTGTERELISWSAFQQTPPVCRVAADIQRGNGPLRLDIALMAKLSPLHEIDDSPDPGHAPARVPPIEKRLRVNGAPRRAVDFVGQLNAVAFSVLDIALIGGEPALRRRYLDITNSQINTQYLRQLQRYHRVLVQRNRLLRRISERQAGLDELSFWDSELVQTGSYLIVQREHTVAALSGLASTIHDELSGSQGDLHLDYSRSIDKGSDKGGSTDGEVAEIFYQALQARRDRELAQGVSLVGPHRDDLAFLVNDTNIGTYGSRGQQRTVALSLKLAEAQFMLARTGDHPILLLDDVLSELDSQRRDHLLHSVTGYQQVLVTTTDLDHFEADFLSEAQLLEVAEGRIGPLSA
jgi:DNA replication and repair protein RecF